MSVRKITAAAVLDIAEKVRQLQEAPDGPKFENHSYCVGFAVGCVIRASAKSKDPKVLAHRDAAKQAYYDYKNHGVLPDREPVKKDPLIYDEVFDPEEWEKHPLTEDDFFFPDNQPLSDIANYVSP